MLELEVWQVLCRGAQWNRHFILRCRLWVTTSKRWHHRTRWGLICLIGKKQQLKNSSARPRSRLLWSLASPVASPPVHTGLSYSEGTGGPTPRFSWWSFEWRPRALSSGAWCLVLCTVFPNDLCTATIKKGTTDATDCCSATVNINMVGYKISSFCYMPVVHAWTSGRALVFEAGSTFEVFAILAICILSCGHYSWTAGTTWVSVFRGSDVMHWPKVTSLVCTVHQCLHLVLCMPEMNAFRKFFTI